MEHKFTSSTEKDRAATRTLESLGYAYQGGQFWKPPADQTSAEISWDGEGIPPAGVECEAREVAHSHGQWRVLTVLYSSDDYLLAIYSVSDPKPRIYSTDSFLFRKIMTDEERRQLRKTKAVEEIACVMTGNRENWGNYLTLAELIYDSIEAGEIPGIPALEKDQ